MLWQRVRALLVGAALLCGANVPPNSGWALDVCINLDQGRKLPPNVFGVNNFIVTSPIYYSHPDFINKFTGMGCATIRYPGGHVSNYLNPLTGFYDGDCPSANEAIRIKNQGNGEDPGEFFGFLDATGAAPDIALNVSTMTAAQTRDWLERIKNAGHSPPFFELGNELFFPRYSNDFPEGADYVEKARAVATEIRDVFPTSRVGVVIPTAFYLRRRFLDDGVFHTDDRQDMWVHSLLDDPSFYDAVVLHVYSHLSLPANENWPFERTYRNAVSHADYRLSLCLSEIRSLFPGKAIWVTEYGTDVWAPQYANHRLDKTYLGSLHQADLLMRFLVEPDVDLANAHSFINFIDYSAVAPVDGRIPPSASLQTCFVPYAFMSLFAAPIDEMESVVLPVLSGAHTYPGGDYFEGVFPDVQAAYLYKGNLGYLIVVNELESSYALENITIAKDGTNQNMTLLEGVTYSPDARLPPSEAHATIDSYMMTTFNALHGAVLPPYSVTRIKLRYTAGGGSPQPVAGHDYHISTNNCVLSVRSPLVDGANVKLANENVYRKMDWRIINASGGYCQLLNRAAGTSDLVLEVEEGNVVVGHNNFAASQFWRIEPTGLGNYIVVNAATDQVLSAVSPAVAGSNVKVAPFTGYPKQRWVFWSQ